MRPRTAAAREAGAPPFQAVDLLDLLWMHQGSLATRAFSEGNREYLELMIDAAQRLVRALAEAPRSPFLPRSKVAALVSMIGAQEPANSAETARRAVPILSELRGRYGAAHASTLYMRGPLPPLPADYSRIAVYFGAAMGLGDQITFFQFLLPLLGRCRRARTTVYTLYPGLWPRLLPGVEEVGFRDDPLRAFVELNRPTAEGGRELVVCADFEVFNLHRHVIAQRPERDILELSLGRMSAWLNGGDSPWIRVESFSSGTDNNYGFMQLLTARLVPGDEPPLWRPVPPNPKEAPGSPRRAAGRRARDPQEPRTILVNPFTSKKLPFTPYLWEVGIHDVRARLRSRVPFEVVVYPGVERSTHDFAAEICARLSRGAAPIPARLLTASGEPLTPLNALAAVVEEAERVDLCVTADTFTAHLVPMFEVPTVVLAYSHFQKFWVPCRWSFNVPLEQMKDRGLPLVAAILALLAGSSPASERPRQKAAALLRATREASRGELTPRALGRIEAALADLFRDLAPSFPAYAEVQRWLLLWGRLAWAHRREAGTQQGLSSYLRLWEESEAFRLLAVGA